MFGALYRHDDAHAGCRALLEQAQEAIVLPSSVLPELDYMVTARSGPVPMVGLLRDVERGVFQVADLPLGSYPRVRELIDRFADSDIGFVDASIIALAESMKETRIATLDRRHFSLFRTRNGDPYELLP